MRHVRCVGCVTGRVEEPAWFHPLLLYDDAGSVKNKHKQVYVAVQTPLNNKKYIF